MKKYFSCYNNGVTAIVSEETYDNIQKHEIIWQLFMEQDFNSRTLPETAREGLEHLLVPIFTFTRPDRFNVSPWLTGDVAFLNELYAFIKESGGTIESGSFYVPFSNGCETGVHGTDAMKRELRHVTTGQQFRETFGISLSEIKERVRSSE